MPTSEAEPEEDDDLEQSHTDKLVGLFTEPGVTFKTLASFAPKTVDRSEEHTSELQTQA